MLHETPKGFLIKEHSKGLGCPQKHGSRKKSMDGCEMGKVKIIIP
jgi:hypothetical protein